MTPVIKSKNCVNKIVELESKKKKLERFSFIRIIMIVKYKSICDSISYNYDLLHEFYPELSDIYDINIFLDLLKSGFIKNKVRSAVIGSEILDG